MRLLTVLVLLLACWPHPAAAQKATAPAWPFHRTVSWPPFQGVVVVFHEYKVFGRTTRLSKGHESRPIRTRRYPYKPKKFWGWKSKRTFDFYNRQGQRITRTRYKTVGVEVDHRIVVSRHNVYEYIDSLGRTTPYDFPHNGGPRR